MLTNKQKQAIHIAAKEAGIDSHRDRESYKLVLRNIGCFNSAADRTVGREAFIAVMAFFERRAGGWLKGCSAGYWAAEDAKANPTAPIVRKIRAVGDELGMDVDNFIRSKHCSSGLFASLEDAPARWLVKCLEGLKAIRNRRDRAARKEVSYGKRDDFQTDTQQSDESRCRSDRLEGVPF